MIVPEATHDALQPDVLHLEEDLPARVQPGGDQVLHDLLLTVDPDRAAGEFGQRDPVALSSEAQLDALVQYLTAK